MTGAQGQPRGLGRVRLERAPPAPAHARCSLQPYSGRPASLALLVLSRPCLCATGPVLFESRRERDELRMSTEELTLACSAAMRREREALEELAERRADALDELAERAAAAAAAERPAPPQPQPAVAAGGVEATGGVDAERTPPSAAEATTAAAVAASSIAREEAEAKVRALEAKLTLNPTLTTPLSSLSASASASASLPPPPPQSHPHPHPPSPSHPPTLPLRGSRVPPSTLSPSHRHPHPHPHPHPRSNLALTRSEH